MLSYVKDLLNSLGILQSLQPDCFELTQKPLVVDDACIPQADKAEHGEPTGAKVTGCEGATGVHVSLDCQHHQLSHLSR